MGRVRVRWDGTVSSPWVRAIAVWLLLLVVVVALGAAREKWLRPRLGELRAHQAGTLVAAVAVQAMALVTVRWMGGPPLGIGAVWLCLTVAFESAMGRLLMKRPWRCVFADYNLHAGRVWSIFLLVTLFAPWLATLLTGR
jgi:hypothetical protein